MVVVVYHRIPYNLVLSGSSIHKSVDSTNCSLVPHPQWLFGWVLWGRSHAAGGNDDASGDDDGWVNGWWNAKSRPSWNRQTRTKNVVNSRHTKARNRHKHKRTKTRQHKNVKSWNRIICHHGRIGFGRLKWGRRGGVGTEWVACWVGGEAHQHDGCHHFYHNQRARVSVYVYVKVPTWWPDMARVVDPINPQATWL